MMCTSCGCSSDTVRLSVSGRDHSGEVWTPGPRGEPPRTWGKRGRGVAATHAGDLNSPDIVQIGQRIATKNRPYAVWNRAVLAERGVLALNLVSSPGAGKTTLLARTIADNRAHFPLALIQRDPGPGRGRADIGSGVAAVLANPGRACLDAYTVGRALESLNPRDGCVLFIENVGNLVYPAAFDLGESHRVVMVSVADGEDCPMSHPEIFQTADLMIVNKTDLLPGIRFDWRRSLESALRVNPAIQVLSLSAREGDGMLAWYGWLAERRRDLRSASKRVPSMKPCAASGGSRPGRF